LQTNGTLPLFSESKLHENRFPIEPPPKIERYEIPRYRVSLVRERNLTSHTPVFRCSQDVYRFIKQLFNDADREQLIVLMLDTKNTLIGTNVVSIGTLAASPVSASNLFKAAILTNSAQILVVHNHPSGIPDPSYEDQQVTAKIKEAGKILDIQLIDHIIVGEGRWYSFKEAGQV
jgi:DNA repair protein RadC